jgi:hypothetical protein
MFQLVRPQKPNDSHTSTAVAPVALSILPVSMTMAQAPRLSLPDQDREAGICHASPR